MRASPFSFVDKVSLLVLASRGGARKTEFAKAKHRLSQRQGQLFTVSPKKFVGKKRGSSGFCSQQRASTAR